MKKNFDTIFHFGSINNVCFAEIELLLSEIKQCFQAISLAFRYGNQNDEEDETSSRAGAGDAVRISHALENIFANPAKLCQAIKFSFEQFYVACVKIIRVLDLFSSKHESLTKLERAEFIKSVKNSIPFCMEQLKRFLKAIHRQIVQLSDNEKFEIAEYMTPEVSGLSLENSTLANIINSIEIVALDRHNS